MAKMRFVVTLDAPEGCSREDIAWYIQDAVSFWKGSKEPGVDPLFDIDGSSVVVRDPLTKQKFEDY